MHDDPIDYETIDTLAGEYRVAWYADEYADQPYNDGFALAVDGWEYYGADSRIDIEHGDIPAEVWSVLRTSGRNRDDSWDYELRSGAALVRYLTLKGYMGVTLVDRDYRAEQPSANRRERVYGVAWDVGGSTDQDICRNNVKLDLEEWRAWAEGDVFSWIVTDPAGNDVESVGGYYGFNREREYTLSEARAAAEYDAAQRIEQVNRAGAGIVGLI